MPTLSLAMIVKNEEKNLGHCLASVQDLVDEMVVVDTGSTDGTVALAESFGARIGHFPWTGDFAAARNESLRLCTGDWVLVLDADEAVDVLDHPKVREAIAQEDCLAYNLISRNYSESADWLLLDQVALPNTSDYTEGAQFPYYGDAPNMRLFRRFPDVAYEGRIHELVIPYFIRRNLPMGALDVVVHHYGKVDYAREREKLDRYLALAEKDVAAHPLNEQCQFNLMIQAHAAGKYETAVRSGLAYIRLMPRTPLRVFTILGMSLQGMGRHKDAIACFETVLGVKADHALSLERLALSLRALGRAAEARKHLMGVLEARPTYSPPYFALAELEEQDGHAEAARSVLLRGLQQLPTHPQLHFILVQLDLRHGRAVQAAADAWTALQAVPEGGGGHWHALVAGYLLKEGHRDQGLAILGQGLSIFKDHPGLLRLQSLTGA
jgi:glycosyltransferase involved in cell wall biosynthesis